MAYQSQHALDELATFVAIVEANGFTAAARASGARKATLSARLASLERRLGVPLLVRTTRSIRLTDEGRAYLEHAQRAIAAVRDAEAVVAAARVRPSGLLRVTAPTQLGALLLEYVVIPYLVRHAGVAVQLDTSVRRIDLVREGFDLAVRLGPLEDSELIARRLGTTSGGYFASPRYLAHRGTPQHPKDLAEHDAIAIPRGDGPIEWTFATGARRFTVIIRPRLSVTSFDLGARAAIASLGILRAPTHFVQRYVARKQLVRILTAWSPPDAELFAVLAPGGASVPKTRAFLDMLVAWFTDRAR